MNKMIQRQDLVPPWIEKQQELLKAARVFRTRLRSDWRRYVARMIAAEGVLTSRGGRTSHAAVVARGMGKTAVCGAEELEVDVRELLARSPELELLHLVLRHDGRLGLRLPLQLGLRLVGEVVGEAAVGYDGGLRAAAATAASPSCVSRCVPLKAAAGSVCRLWESAKTPWGFFLLFSSGRVPARCFDLPAMSVERAVGNHRPQHVHL